MKRVPQLIENDSNDQIDGEFRWFTIRHVELVREERDGLIAVSQMRKVRQQNHGSELQRRFDEHPIATNDVLCLALDFGFHRRLVLATLNLPFPGNAILHLDHHRRCQEAFSMSLRISGLDGKRIETHRRLIGIHETHLQQLTDTTLCPRVDVLHIVVGDVQPTLDVLQPMELLLLLLGIRRHF